MVNPAAMTHVFQPARRVALYVLAAAALTVLPSRAVLSQDATNVLLVVNRASDDSRQIGDLYARTRGVPPEQVLQVVSSTEDEISREAYSAQIERPIALWLRQHSAQDRILYIVLTKGLPLRITGTAGRSGTVSSVDSELTLLYRKLTGATVPPGGGLANPYFLADRPVAQAAPFSHATLDIYLVTRLDGFTVRDVISLIERGKAPQRDGRFLLDQRGSLIDPGGNRWLRIAADRLAEAGLANRTVLETTSSLLVDQDHVLGYYSWGSNDEAFNRRKLGLQFEPGALVATFVSTDARTFKEPPDTWKVGSNWQDPKALFAGSPQSLIGDLIREGATGAAGHVAEPFLDGTIRPEILFPAYVAGLNLAESYYLAMPFLSWQTVVIGDPLCAPFRTTGVASDLINPSMDPDTELPGFFSARRTQALVAGGVSLPTAKLLIQADTRLAKDDRDGARIALEKATALDSRQRGAHFVLATIYEDLGEYDKAIDRYRTVLGMTPTDVVSLNNLAYALAVRKDMPKEGLPYAQQAYQLTQGRSAAIADTLGWIHHMLGNKTEAERFLKQAVAQAAGNVDIRLHLVQFLAETGRREEGASELRKLLQTDPSLDERAAVKQLRRTLGF